MNIRKISVFLLSAVMVFMMTSCSKQDQKDSYNFGGAKSVSDVKEHFTEGTKPTQDFYLTVKETNTDFESYTEFYRVDGEEVRLIRYDGYQTRFIRDNEKYVVIDDIKELAALYPRENAHDDIMWSDMDFIISIIDTALSGELINSGYSEETKDSFTEVYKTENGEEFAFWIVEGKLQNIAIMDNSGTVIAVYDIHYDSKGGKKSLFKYKGYKLTDMRIEKTDTSTTEE